ncbi:hypothetical protein T10_3782, partial [Trichinella papuae]
MKVLYLQRVEFTDFYIHIEQYAAVGLQQNTIDGKTEDKSYFNFYDIMYTHITTIQYLEIVKVIEVLEILTKCESIKELDAENECRDVALKRND